MKTYLIWIAVLILFSFMAIVGEPATWFMVLGACGIAAIDSFLAERRNK